MAVLRVLSTLALAGLVQAMTPDFEASAVVRLEATFQPTALLLPRLLAGETVDAVLLTVDGMERLVQESLVEPESVVPLARAFVGVAVKAGAARPDISTPDAFVAALRAAESVAMSRSGASGLFLAGLLDRLGIADEIRAKAVVIESGFTAELAANGVVELALQQVSELMVVPGVDVVGRMPAELGGETVFSGGVMAGSAQGTAAAALLDELAGAGPLLATLGLAEA